MDRWGKRRAFRTYGTRCIPLALVSLVALCGGCHKSEAPADKSTTASNTASPPPVPAMDTILRVHWLGKKNMAADTNFAGLTKIWNFPETTRLEAEVIEKLSTAPWRFLRGETNQASAKLLAPLLDDIVQEECYVEIRQPSNVTNLPGETVIAVRLSDQRADLWNTNLAATLESLTGIRPVPAGNGWSLKKHHVPNLLQLSRADGWTLVAASEDGNRLLDETVGHIQRDCVPFDWTGTNALLEANVDLRRVGAALGHELSLPATFPRISLTVAGDGQNVRTRGELSFPEPVVHDLPPWNIPTNLIDADLYSFSAFRGWTPEFISRLWNKAGISNPPPREFYAWSLNGAPMQTYFVAPVADASNAVSKLSDLMIQESRSLFATNDMVRFERAKTFNGLEWKGVPFISPFLKSVEDVEGGFILGGFLAPVGSHHTAPQFIRDLPDRTNLLFCDWELTGPRIGQLTYLSQFMRLVKGEPQLPSRSAPLEFLLRMARSAGPSQTEIVRAAPERFSFERSSDIPFTAIEMQLLAGWIESPRFPELDISPAAHR